MTFPTSRVVRRWAGAAAVVMASALSLTACSDDPADPTPASGEATGQPATDEPTPTDEPSPESPTVTPTEDDGTAVPVYFAGDGPGGRTVLYREFHRVTGDPLTEAAALVAGGQPDDPDYRTLWPGVDVSSVTATDGVLLVEIPSDAFTERPDGMSRRDARLALQQLVYTLQGVQQERIPVVIERGDVDRVFGIPTGTGLTASSALRTLNLVNITSPAEGDTVTGDTVRVTGVASSFEASGPCRLTVGDQELALEAYQAEGWTEDKLFPFEVELPLGDVTGDVTVQCETDDPSGGAEGHGPAVDTKLIHVE